MASKKATAKLQLGPASKGRANNRSGAKVPRSKAAAASKQKQKSPSDPPKHASAEAEHETHPIINQVPTKVLSVLVFGNGDNSELGLGPKQTEASRPSLNPFLDPKDPTKYHITQLACGGMHTIALTIDDQIITWGVNDEFALGRDTHWIPERRDMDTVPDDDAELNPLESTPLAIPAAHFPPNTRFCQVAAGDSYSIALTDTGLAYGWGTFRDSEGNSRFGYNNFCMGLK
ncbi:regulator of chromosome condensation (RCC1) repeat domain-containing protein [Hirsutella rhossiliensis]|uniref:Regulator of chromosome condensation (RCC1) repeat domain-containing protein n=1 Tax=Hirsutella rhossiliensis TaxID=111463 RepID=A0A9P8MY76_9HYPO|nr:regulator of chromosome condensation (RCC1) repeat domain-containing protein [Hirsutella rhossiliensis]KAH0964243.1 regulator of chromosome condensation (RCC1) repeat domain-containing protein [Hirsutella rhossiliensis]